MNIRQIIEKKRISVYFQPIVSIRDGEIWIVEALSRGIGDDGELIPPLALFAAAAEQNLMDELDAACRDIALAKFKKLSATTSRLLLSLNISGSLLNDPAGTHDHLFEQVVAAGVPPSKVILEILEQRLPSLQTAQAFAERHRKNGFLIALDDVGAGYSNLNRITMIKPDILKFDRSLLSNLDKEYHKQEVARALIGLCHRIGALAIAEGVEQDVEAMEAKTLGFDLYQGYYFSYPLDTDTSQLITPSEKILHIRRGYQKNTIARNTMRKIYHKRYMEAVDEIVCKVKDAAFDELGRVAQELSGTHRALECIYLLGASGRMLTNSVFPYRVALRMNSVFRPAQSGNDLSIKEYFVHIQNGAESYISEPYISQATGNMCVTIAKSFFHATGKRMIACLDFDLNMKRLVMEQT